MDAEKRSTANKLDRFHDRLHDRIREVLPCDGDVVIELTMDEAVGLVCEYVFRKGQVEGMTETFKMTRRDD